MPQEDEQRDVFSPEDHPWLSLPDDSLDEALRYSLDEIRIA